MNLIKKKVCERETDRQTETEKPRERECVCVCVCDRERAFYSYEAAYNEFLETKNQIRSSFI